MHAAAAVALNGMQTRELPQKSFKLNAFDLPQAHTKARIVNGQTDVMDLNI